MADRTVAILLPEPVSRLFGFDRGTPIDRYYIERFLHAHSRSIRGCVLEIGDATYTKKFGGDVRQSDVLHAVAGNQMATIVGNLETGEGIPTDAFDCIILTQVLPFVFDVRSAIANCHRALRAGGIVLATVPGISQISRYDMDRWGDFWRFTNLSARRLFKEHFETVDVQSFGNVAVATAFLQGLALHEIPAADLEHDDPDYPVIITIRAQRGQVA
jgi:SAM-dependent methyltransferase